MKRQTLRLAVALLCGLGLALMVLVSGDPTTTTLADSGVVYVAPDGGCDAGITPCFGSIQAAVDAANSGDTILVATGTYTDVQTLMGTKQMALIDKSVTVRGGYSPSFNEPSSPTLYPTTLDANKMGRVFVLTGTVDVTLDGLNITGGDSFYGQAGVGPPSGGGIKGDNVTLTLSNSWVYGNGFGAHGGGLYMTSSNLRMYDNTITNNSVAGAGGGLSLSGGTAILDRNVIRNNSAIGSGGGLGLSGIVTMTNNIIADNRTQNFGSGVSSGYAKVRMLHNTLARNTGGDGVGIRASHSTMTLTNTILVSHTFGISATGGTVTADATLWGSGAWANGTNMSGNVTSSGDVTGDPDFVDPDQGDYHIGAASAAVNAGVNAGVTADIDGEDRPVGGGYDLGADEVVHRTYLPALFRLFP